MLKANEPKMPSSSPHFRLLGDIGHGLSLINTMIFAVSVILWIGEHESDQKNAIFDAQWKKEGFCITNRETLFWNSHAVCLYMDVTFAVILGALYWSYHHRSDLSYLNVLIGNSVFGVLGHGLAHGHAAYDLHYVLKGGFRSDDFGRQDELAEQNLLSHVAMYYIFLPLVLWLPLMKAAMPDTKFSMVLVCAFSSHLIMASFPRKMFFTCVQTILMMVASINQMFRPIVDKMDLHYCLYAWMVVFPVSLVGWLESTKCSAFVRDALYGHVMYDAYLPTSMIVYYFICLYFSNEKQKSVKVDYEAFTIHPSEIYKEDNEKKDDEVCQQQYLNNHCTHANIHHNPKEAMRPSSAEKSEAQQVLLKPTHRNLTIGAIPKESVGNGVTKSGARQRLHALDTAIIGHSRVFNNPDSLCQVKEYSDLTATLSLANGERNAAKETVSNKRKLQSEQSVGAKKAKVNSEKDKRLAFMEGMEVDVRKGVEHVIHLKNARMKELIKYYFHDKKVKGLNTMDKKTLQATLRKLMDARKVQKRGNVAKL